MSPEDFDPSETEPPMSAWDPRSFESWRINLLAPPLVALLAVGVTNSMFGFFLQGFYVWIHEFGHATVAWLTGYRALPLPIGWTNVAPEKSLFVYFGVLFLLGLLFVAGVRERKPAALAAALGLALVQGLLTWKLPAETAEMWRIFAGAGGQLYLSAAMVGLFYFQLPEKFRWGSCRYFFLFIGAGSFWENFSRWRLIRHGDEGIPYGSMIHGEEDANGDMNRLHDEFGWTQSQIIHTYNHLATACLVAIAVVYVFFALRLDRWPARWLERAATDIA